jgi:Fe-S-cluster containining protein
VRVHCVSESGIFEQVGQITQKKELEKLCLSCGLCCNGVLFANVKLQPADRAKVLLKLGIPVQSTGVREKFHQPCVALSNCTCAIYKNRPTHCRSFECLLYKHVQSGEVSSLRALKRVKEARGAAAEVERLLEQLGDTDGGRPLRIRCRRQMRMAEKQAPTGAVAEAIADLSLATHRLNRILSEDFYR